MKISKINVYFGPNQYIQQAAIGILLDLSECDNAVIPDFEKKVVAHITQLISPSLPQFDKAVLLDTDRNAQPPGFNLANIIKQLIITLLHEAKHPLQFSTLQTAKKPGYYRILYDYVDANTALMAGNLAFNLLADCVTRLISTTYPEQQSFFFAAQYRAFLDHARQPKTIRTALITAARSKQIPVIALDGPVFFPDKQSPPAAHLKNVLQLGYGFRQHRIKNTLLNSGHYQTSLELADYLKNKHFLSKSDCPVARQDPENSHINSLRRAQRCAQRIGYPVTLKPISPEHRHIVFTHLINAEQLAFAYQQVQPYSRTVHIEAGTPGYMYQLLVVSGDVFCAIKILPCYLIGDGQHSIAQLIDTLSGKFADLPVLLAEPKQTHERIPGLGEKIAVASSLGPVRLFTQPQVKHSFHPELINMAIASIEKLQLDIGAVNIITTDQAQPLSATKGVFSSIDAEPNLDLYQDVENNIMEKLAQHIIAQLFPPQKQSRIPVIAVTGTNGKTTTCRMLAHILKTAGYCTGLACTDGLYVDGILQQRGTFSGVVGALHLLSVSAVQAAVIETSRGTLNKKGLGFDFCNIGMCTNIASDHIGIDGINSLQEMADVKKVVLENSRDLAIVNADDPYCLNMLKDIPTQNICLVSSNKQQTHVNAHIENGGQAIVAELFQAEKQLAYFCSGTAQAVFPVHAISTTLNGSVAHNIDNAMFAIAAAIGLNIQTGVINAALKSFQASFECTPGRLNFFAGLPFQVLVDYAHNAHSFRALCQYTDKLTVKGKRILLFVVPGDRRDEDFHDSAKTVATHFDYFICRDTVKVRNREAGEAPLLLQNCLLNSGVTKDRIWVIPKLEVAVAKALEMATKHDLVVIAGAHYEAVWEQLQLAKSQMGGFN